MKKLVLALILSFPLNLLALELKVGDVLLQPLDCWSCALVEQQEGSIYSHMGIVIATGPKVMVAEALGTVKILPYDDFRARNEKGQLLSVLRLRNEDDVNDMGQNKDEFLSYFKRLFEGLKYDHDFLWNNLDEDGYEKMYCSEMVAKFLYGFLHIDMPGKRMKFDKNREQWIQYFHGNPPDDKWGNSPGDFEKSDLFYEVGEI